MILFAGHGFHVIDINPFWVIIKDVLDYRYHLQDIFSLQILRLQEILSKYEKTIDGSAPQVQI
jgi:hypothetical protein